VYSAVCRKAGVDLIENAVAAAAGQRLPAIADGGLCRSFCSTASSSASAPPHADVQDAADHLHALARQASDALDVDRALVLRQQVGDDVAARTFDHSKARKRIR